MNGNDNVRESIVNIRSENEYLIFSVEETNYIISLLEDYNKNYIHKHYNDIDDEIWMMKNDYYGKIMDVLGDIGRTRVCNRCGCEVVYEDDLVTKGYDNRLYNYDCACIVCDDDLDLWETSLVPNERAKQITENDKNEYRKNGCLSIKRLKELEVWD